MGKESEVFQCDCGLTLSLNYKSKERDLARHQTTKKHLLSICTHHWVIESANGPRSTGHCKLCGKSKDFSNSGDIVTTWWGDTMKDIVPAKIDRKYNKSKRQTEQDISEAIDRIQ